MTENLDPMARKRRLRFVTPRAETLRNACGNLLGMIGVKAVAPRGDALVVEYDPRQITLVQLEQACSATGLVLRGGVHAWRRALWRFVEDNEIKNAAHPTDGACCNRPPPHAP